MLPLSKANSQTISVQSICWFVLLQQHCNAPVRSRGCLVLGVLPIKARRSFLPQLPGAELTALAEQQEWDPGSFSVGSSGDECI